jgi:hypothetical protein
MERPHHQQPEHEQSQREQQNGCPDTKPPAERDGLSLRDPFTPLQPSHDLGTQRSARFELH